MGGQGREKRSPPETIATLQSSVQTAGLQSIQYARVRQQRQSALPTESRIEVISDPGGEVISV